MPRTATPGGDALHPLPWWDQALERARTEPMDAGAIWPRTGFVARTLHRVGALARVLAVDPSPTGAGCVELESPTTLQPALHKALDQAA